MQRRQRTGIEEGIGQRDLAKLRSHPGSQQRGGHGFAKPANRMRAYRAMEAFFAQHLGGRAEPGAA